MKIYAWFLSVALLSTSIFAGEAATRSEVSDFKLLFDTILKQSSLNSYELSVHEDHLEITADVEVLTKIKHHLDEALSSQTSFFANLPYRLKDLEPVANNFIMKTDDIPDFKASSAEEAVAVIINLVGEKAFDELSIDINKLFNNQNGAAFNNGVLFSKPINKIAIKTYREIFKVLMAHFININIDDIKNAYLHPNMHLATPSRLPEDDEIEGISGMLQKCFGIMEGQEGTRAFIDVSRIYQLIFPPKIILEQRQKTFLRIQRDHLMTYLQQVNGDRVLLRVFDKSGQKYAHPIVLSEGSHVNKAQYNYIIIDHSISLAKYYDELTQKIKRFTQKLDTTNSANKIKLIFFAETMEPEFLFDVCDSSGIECAIDSTKDNLGGHTRLFHTLRDVFKQIHQEKQIIKYNVSVTVFTDGMDNVGGSFTDIQKEIDSFAPISRPKVFTLGFGNADITTLTQLANAMGGPYIALKSIDDFKQIEKHLAEFKNERELIEFAFCLLNQQHVLTIPVPLDNSPHPLNIVLPMTGESLPVSVQGKNMVAVISQNKNIVQANTTDKIWLLSAQASAIAIDGKSSPKEKISRLHIILGELDQISNTDNLNKHDLLLLKITSERVNKDISEFNEVSLGNKSSDVANASISYRNGLFTLKK